MTSKRSSLYIVSANVIICMFGCHTLHNDPKYYLKHFAVITKKYDWKLNSTTRDTLPAGYKTLTRKRKRISGIGRAEHGIVGRFCKGI